MFGLMPMKFSVWLGDVVVDTTPCGKTGPIMVDWPENELLNSLRTVSMIYVAIMLD
jgi:hypothetical protein